MSQCFKETGQGLSLLIFLVCGLMFGVSEWERIQLWFVLWYVLLRIILSHGTFKGQMSFKWLICLMTPLDFCCIGATCVLSLLRDPCTMYAVELCVSSLTPLGVKEVQSIRCTNVWGEVKSFISICYSEILEFLNWCSFSYLNFIFKCPNEQKWQYFCTPFARQRHCP